MFHMTWYTSRNNAVWMLDLEQPYGHVSYRYDENFILTVFYEECHLWLVNGLSYELICTAVYASMNFPINYILTL